MADEVRATVLVVDDNPQNRALAEATLEAEGYAVLQATSGEEGVQKFASARPDCVLMDVRMPEVDGITACQRIRALPGGDVPIIFLTALRDVETFDHALEAGGDDFLTKPVRPAELVHRVQTALEIKKLSAEVKQHYAQIRHQRDDLMRLQLFKEQLTAFLVHDLKNPVSTIDLNAQLLFRDDALPAKTREVVGRIREDARSLVRMIHNLLDIARGDEGKLVTTPAEVDLPAMIGEILVAFQVRADEKRIEMTGRSEAPRVTADPSLLRRVIENLVENALKHTPESGRVTVSAESGPDGVDIRIADSGSGIPPEMREQVFERFVQLAGGVRAGGRGLGLAFCKLAVEAHRGRIWVEGGNPGSVFCLRLPNG